MTSMVKAKTLSSGLVVFPSRKSMPSQHRAAAKGFFCFWSKYNG